MKTSTWLRNTMTTEKLNGLAQMHIHADIKVNVDEVIDTFVWQNPTRMQFFTYSKIEKVRSNGKK